MRGISVKKKAVAVKIAVAVVTVMGGSVIQDQPWLALVVGFVLSALLAAGIALGQRWWDRRRQVEVAAEEGGDVTARHVVSGAVAVVGGRVAASGDTGGSEPVDVSFEGAAVVVVEQRGVEPVGVQPHRVGPGPVDRRRGELESLEYPIGHRVQ